MHTVTQLHVALPELANNIRRSWLLKKAAVIATGPRAARTLVVTSAVECGEDYHLVHVCDCEPHTFNSEATTAYARVELRPTTWHRLEQVIKRFLAGDNDDHLIRVAAGR
jgi:hypothetical protein